jgi:hypothetical protein
MIDFLTIVGPDGRPYVRQALTHPAVYLDTWALRLLAEDNAGLGARFRAALARAGGTLMISSLSFNEFTSFDDPRHAEAVGLYLDTIYPHLFFSKFDPFQVINDEIPIMVGQTKETPAGDVGMLILFAEDALRTGHTSVRGWFRSLHRARASLRTGLQEMGMAFLEGFHGLRGRFENEPGFGKSALHDIKHSTRPRATQAVLRALLYRLQRDRSRELTVNDALDIGHGIVAAAYCDFVLLDRAWCANFKDACTLMRRYGITTRVAEFYAQRDNGVIRFLEQLEAWPAKSIAA